MKKKKVIICVAIALAVFCLSFASAMIILMLNQDGVQTDTFNDSPVGQNISRALNNCSEPQDYYALAQKLVDDNEIYYANEVIKYGYRQTNDKSLDIAVVTGKPTLETAIIEHDMGSISESVQYFLGRETVVGRPCYSGISLYYNPFIYTFDNTTHRIRTIEVSSLFSYDKLDEDYSRFIYMLTNDDELNPGTTTTAVKKIASLTLSRGIQVELAGDVGAQVTDGCSYRFRFDRASGAYKDIGIGVGGSYVENSFDTERIVFSRGASNTATITISKLTGRVSYGE